MSDAPIYLCSNEPPHRLRLDSVSRTPRGVALTISNADAPNDPARDVFITNSELAGGYEVVYKACFLCVDQGRREKAFAVPKSDLE